MVRGLEPDSANEDEGAAVLAAVLSYLRETTDEPGDAGTVSRWTLAGRLEAHGLTVTRERLARGWRASCSGE